MIKYETTRAAEDCCGCRACEQVCASGAISCSEDAEGFLYPSVAKNLCTECGRCEKVCPMEVQRPPKAPAEAFPQEVYAAYAMDDALLGKSSSGGIFTVVAEAVLARGGIVFGAAFDPAWSVVHAAAESSAELERLRGSKYVQSDIGNTFRRVRQELKSGREVYFTGVPCQVAGLKRFLGRDHANLLTSDLVCHGVPSPKVWRKYLDSFKHPLHNVATRDTENWRAAFVYATRPDGAKTFLHPSFSSFLTAFRDRILNRPACFACPYSRPEREGDITLADYWGVEDHHPEMWNPKGVSLVLVNSGKGRQYFLDASQSMRVKDSRLEWAARRNGNLVRRSTPNPRRAQFFEDLDRLPFSELECKYMRRKDFRSYVVKVRMRKFVRSVLGSLGLKRFQTPSWP